MTVAAPAQQSITSSDGAEIAYWKSGDGAPLVLVHGSISDRTTWALVQPTLEQRFTVYAVNRRGREGSAPPAPHTMALEYEDVANVVDSIGEPVHLLGHSFGAVTALGATKLTSRLRSLILYEPPPLGGTFTEMLDRVRALVEEGRGDEVITTFLSMAIQLEDEQVALLKASPVWPSTVAHAPNLLEELNASADFTFDAAEFADLDIPVLLLVGGASPARVRQINEALAKTLSNARLVELPGQGHVAQLAAPDLFLAEVTKFLDTVE